MSAPLPAVLAGCVVLITADRRSGDLAAAFARRGATIQHAPALSIVPHTDDTIEVHCNTVREARACASRATS